MNPKVEIQAAEPTRDQQADPRRQFIRQVDEQSRPATEILKEQANGSTPQDTARLFVP